jgi:exosome complex RNA-binding protein Csl4
MDFNVSNSQGCTISVKFSKNNTAVEAMRVCQKPNKQTPAMLKYATDVSGNLYSSRKFGTEAFVFSWSATKDMLFGCFKINDLIETDILNLYKEAYCLSNAEKKLQIVKSYKVFKNIIHQNSQGSLVNADTQTFDISLEDTACIKN